MSHVVPIFRRFRIAAQSLTFLAVANCGAVTIRVQTADGGALAGATAICVDQDSVNRETRQTDTRGELVVDSLSGYSCFIVADDAGFGLATSQALAQEQGPIIVVRPWAHLEGVRTNRGRPIVRQQLAICFDAKAYGPNLRNILINIPRLDSLAYTQTDKQGRYVFSRVPPGALQIYERINHPAGTLIPVQNIELAPAEHRTMNIATKGRQVIGRFELVDESTAQLDFASCSGNFQGGLQREQTLEIHADGSFISERVEPGTYLVDDLIERFGTKRLALVDVRSVEIPAAAQMETGDAAFDVGKIVVRKVHELQVGDSAPDFSVTTLDGTPLRRSDFRGKFVLLNFWATWCGPCVAELPAIESVYRDFRSDPRFAFVLLSLDAERKKPAQFVASRNLAGIQGFLGDWSNDGVTRRYAVFDIPALFLIGPDGRIVARDLDERNVRTTVLTALGSH